MQGQNTSFLGYKYHDDVLNALNDARVVLMQSEREGNGAKGFASREDRRGGVEVVVADREGTGKGAAVSVQNKGDGSKGVNADVSGKWDATSVEDLFKAMEERRSFTVNSRTGEVSCEITRAGATETITVSMEDFRAGVHPVMKPRHGDTYVLIGTPVAGLLPTGQEIDMRVDRRAALLRELADVEMELIAKRREAFRLGLFDLPLDSGHNHVT